MDWLNTKYIVPRWFLIISCIGVGLGAANGALLVLVAIW